MRNCPRSSTLLSASFGRLPSLGEERRSTALTRSHGVLLTLRMKSYLCADRTTYTSSVLLLQIDGLVMPSLVELCAPHLVHALVVGPAEDYGRAEPNVEVAQIFQSPD